MPSEARIDLAALRANHELARERSGGRPVVAVVKADAYGHGAPAVARTLVAAGCSRLAVASVAEGCALRPHAPAATILVLGGVTDAEEAGAALEAGLVPVLHHDGQRVHAARAAAGSGRALAVHVEIDTGMRRLGVPEKEAEALLAAVVEAPSLRLAGVLTHLACADEPEPSPSLEQLARFRERVAALRRAGVDPGLVHVANSAALLAWPELERAFPEVGAMRPGLLLYGVSPAPHLDAPLRPVMTLRSTVVALRAAGSGDTVGYGGTHRVEGRTRIATVGMGYADGIPWALGNRGHALVRGRRVPYAGRVSMDLVTLDVGTLPVEVGDEVILFGVGQGARLPVEELAEAAGTIPYELLVRVGQRVPRRTVG